jgi:hypothetical protein
MLYLCSSRTAEEDAVDASPITDLNGARLKLHLGTSQQSFPIEENTSQPAKCLAVTRRAKRTRRGGGRLAGPDRC